jgi:hypothetical protein
MSEASVAIRKLRRDATDIARAIETVFEGASMSVFDRLAELRQMARALEQIERAAAEESRTLLTRSLRDAGGYLDDIDGQYTFLEGVSGKLHLNAAKIRDLLHQQRRNMRLVSMIATNAQVVSKSIELNHGSLANFAEQVIPIISSASQAATAVGDDLMRADVQLETVAERIGVLSACARDLKAMRAELPDMLGSFGHHDAFEKAVVRIRAASAQLSEALSASVSSLQCGDASRQRLEHVDAMLAVAEDAPPGLRDALHAIAAAQFDATVDELRSAVDDVLPRFAAIATITATARDEVARLSDLQFTTSLDAVADFVRAMAAGFDRLRDIRIAIAPEMEALTDSYVQSAVSAQRIAEFDDQMFHLGVNATLVSSKIGEQGRAMVEVSHQLRECTAAIGRASAEIVHLAQLQELNAVLFTVLAEARDDSVATSATSMLEEMAGSITAGLSTAGRLVGRDAFTPLDTARANLALFQEKTHVGGRADRPEHPDVTGLRADDRVLQKVRASYTMQSERDLHDQVLERLGVSPGADPGLAAE